MPAWWPGVVLVVIVSGILAVARRPMWAPLFRWLPIPLWCYVLPMAAVSLGWLPPQHAVYRQLTTVALPIALVLLLLGVDLAAVARAGRGAVLAAVVGAVGIIVGAALAVWLLQHQLPTGAWRGAAALVGTWTGGTMNLLALRMLLATPDVMFAPLIIVDAITAYSWMALLVAASAYSGPINAWLRVPPHEDSRAAASSVHPANNGTHGAPRAEPVVPSWPPVGRNPERAHGQPVPSEVEGRPWCESRDRGTRRRGASRAICAVIALGLTWLASWCAARLPTTALVASAAGWSVLLITAAALALSTLPAIRRLGDAGAALGYPCLYLVLAATGAQTHLSTLWSAPVWLLVGLVIVLVHGGLVLLAGWRWRIPLGILATASQANIGGVVSAPLVGAMYHESLVPVGLLLALAGNALGTYLGLAAAALCRWIVPN